MSGNTAKKEPDQNFSRGQAVYTYGVAATLR